MTARYVVIHDTRYSYEAKVGISRQVLHLTPRVLPWQTLGAHELRVTPRPDVAREGTDAFGNTIREFCVERDHDELRVVCESRVAVSERSYPNLAESPPWEKVRDALSYRADARSRPTSSSRRNFSSSRRACATSASSPRGRSRASRAVSRCSPA